MILKIEQLRIDFRKTGKKSKCLVKRLGALIDLAKSRSQFATSYSEQGFESVAAKHHKAPRTLRRWMNLYNEGGTSSLESKTRSNRKRDCLRGRKGELITQYRRLYNWGAETIQAHLKHDHKIFISRYKINEFLRLKKFLKKKRKKKIKNKHTTVVVVETPGTHTQTDVKHLPRILPGVKTYVYNFVDHASRWEYKEAFTSYCPMNTLKFFKNVIATAPFRIVYSQTDNGVEFTYKYISRMGDNSKNCYELFLADEGIKHRLIPVGETRSDAKSHSDGKRHLNG
ncbi:MAG: hypothetical protein SGJ18_07670 [Pseudomonadota bacterium]|nr:hypothetical protein [Pseudomonadota bacterium]